MNDSSRAGNGRASTASRNGPGSGWRSASAAALLVLPQPLTSLLVTLSIGASFTVSRIAGLPPPAIQRATVGGLAELFYGLLVGLAAFGAWRWSVRWGNVGDVFAFRRIGPLDALLVIGLSAMLLATEPAVARWLSRVADTPHVAGHGVPRQPFALAATVFAAVAAAPIAEEILFRGLLPAWLRGLNWPAWLILPVGSLAFASIHVVFFGFAWAAATLWFGAVLLALRMWRGSLTPCWLIHLAFNAANVVLLPAVPSLRHALGL